MTQVGTDAGVQTCEARLDPEAARRFVATLGLASTPPAAGEPLPLGWHWLSLAANPARDDLGPDGRGTPGDVVPPMPGLNRMWAGGSFEASRPLLAGSKARRSSRLVRRDEKTGRSGRLVLVTVRHDISDAQGVAVVEHQDLVFRERAAAATPGGERAHAAAVHQYGLTPDEVMLFRFSALTWNAHRIHYDRTYTTQTEGYADLLVHGPLTALLLLHVAGQALGGRAIGRFEYRAVRPLYCGRPMRVCAGKPASDGAVAVWAEDNDGFVAMRGQACGVP